MEGKAKKEALGWRGDSLPWTVALLACWLALHPYKGVIHDARLYAVQALQALTPGRFAGDLFFAHGSQDAFTVFSAIYRPLIALMGVGAAHLALTALGQALWLGGLVLLMRRLYPEGPVFRIALLAAVVGAADYGGLNVLTYAETFATPRLFAEALVLGALALGLGRRWIAAAGLIVGAGALHPVMAAGGAAVLALLAAQEDRRLWALAAVAGLAGAGLAFAHVAPFDRLLVVLDPQWMEIVRRRCALAFITQWRWMDMLLLAAAFALPAAAWARAAPAERRFLGAVLLVGALGCVATLVGGDLAGDVLVVNAQPWRALWLVALMANASAGALISRAAKGGVAREFLAAGLAAGALATLFETTPVAPAVLYLVAAAAVVLEPRLGASLSAPARIVLRVVACAAGLFAVGGAWLAMTGDRAAGFGWGPILGLTALVAVAAALALRPRSALLAGLLLALGAGAALARVDARDGWERFVEDPRPDAGLDAFLAGSGATYWEFSPEVLWLKQRQASYYSCVQGAGVMFFRGTAIDYARRGHALAPLDTLDFDNGAGGMCSPSGAPQPDKPVSAADLSLACAAAPELDTVILHKPVAGAEARTWTAPAAKRFQPHGRAPVETNRFYRYDCRDFRPGR